MTKFVATALIQRKGRARETVPPAVARSDTFVILILYEPDKDP